MTQTSFLNFFEWIYYYILGLQDSFVDFYYSASPYFLWYYSAINVVYLLLLTFGMIRVYQRRKEVTAEDLTTIVKSNSFAEISFVMPIYNNSKDALSAAKNLHALSYRYKKIILVNDGSSDNSLPTLLKGLNLVPIPKFYSDQLPTKPIRGVYQSSTFPEIFLIDKENGHKFDALNAGINAISSAYLISIDPDTFIDDNEFEAIIRPILFDPNIIGIGASVRIRNGCTLSFNKMSTATFPKKFLPTMQSLEYLRAFLEREGWDSLGGNICISGAFSVYRKEALLQVGGYIDSVANDMEIVVRLHRFMRKNQTPYRIVYLPDPVAWTEGPSTLKTLKKQRIDWHKGLLETLWIHKGLFFNPKYGLYGLFTMPFWVWGEAFEPLVETLGYIVLSLGLLLGLSDMPFVFLFLLLTWGYNLVFTIFCILIEDFGFRKYTSFKSISILVLSALIENLGYKQLTVYWRVRGFFAFFKEFSFVRDLSKKTKVLLKNPAGKNYGKKSFRENQV